VTIKKPLLAAAILGWIAPTLDLTLAGETLDRSPEAVLERVSSEVRYLASDELAGRDVGTPGIDAAAEYIRTEFKKMGLKSGAENGSYYQPFDISGTKSIVEGEVYLVLTGPDGTRHELKLGEQFQPQLTGGDGQVEGDLVFVGYGISADEHNFDEYADLDVKDKIVIALRREPQQDDENSVFDGKENSNYARINTKLGFARGKGAKALILVNDWYTTEKEEGDILASPELFGTRGSGIPFAHMKQSVLQKILATTPIQLDSGEKLETIEAISDNIDENLQPRSQALEGWKVSYQVKSTTDNIVGNNVIGIIEGEGPHADETIVIGGHYDHLGMGLFGSRTPGRREVHNGADDNATGTVAVVELARRFAVSDTKPSRRLVFIGFSGEERGLLGSRYYVEHPVVPMESTVAMINFDMIGWLRDDVLTIYGAGTSPEFGAVIEAAGKETGLDLKPISAGFAGSDHLPFQQKQVPALFLHTGLTSTYHTPDDDYETLNMPGCVRVIDYSENLINELLSLDEAPTFANATRRPPRPRTAYLGARINFSDDITGLVVQEVTEDSPAAKAGLKTGDVITANGDDELKTREDLLSMLQENAAGDKLVLKVKRGEEVMEVEVTLSRPPARTP
jgi:hypothetical protein